jgi:hypothetical protein
VRAARLILVVAWLVSQGCGSSEDRADAGDAAAERPPDGHGGGSAETGAEVEPGDCPASEAFPCVASCSGMTPTPLICDDGHWECESGVDARQCNDAGI